MNTLDDRHLEAMKRYNARYDNVLYLAATNRVSMNLNEKVNRKDLLRAFALQDAAIAICGSPYERIDPAICWRPEEQAFLDKFM